MCRRIFYFQFLCISLFNCYIILQRNALNINVINCFCMNIFCQCCRKLVYQTITINIPACELGFFWKNIFNNTRCRFLKNHSIWSWVHLNNYTIGRKFSIMPLIFIIYFVSIIPIIWQLFTLRYINKNCCIIYSTKRYFRQIFSVC